jgi:Transposase, Mutator family
VPSDDELALRGFLRDFSRRRPRWGWRRAATAAKKAGWVVNTKRIHRTYLIEADPDLVRTMLQTFAEALMSAEASGLCGAEYGEVSPERVNSRKGYRSRRWDTRAGSIERPVRALFQLTSSRDVDAHRRRTFAQGPKRPRPPGFRANRSRAAMNQRSCASEELRHDHVDARLLRFERAVDRGPLESTAGDIDGLCEAWLGPFAGTKATAGWIAWTTRRGRKCSTIFRSGSLFSPPPCR